MNQGLSNQVRAMAQAKYVKPAICSGKREFSIRVRDLHEDLLADGFPSRHVPQICSALQTSKFLRENGIEIEEVSGPPKKQSPNVVVRYRVRGTSPEAYTVETGARRGHESQAEVEDPAARALRLTGKLRGLLKEEFAAVGGGEAFLRWVRSEDADAA